ncbi:MAG TPA: HEAT repeat domain-containing protein, partial [Planctomycetota bacterium]
AAAILLTTDPKSTVSPPRPTGAPPAPVTSPNRPTPASATLEERALKVAGARDVDALRKLAAEWRRSAREDREFRRRLAGIVLNSAVPTEARELAAFVLGSLADREGLEALSQALEGSCDPAWSRTLLLALGSDRSSEDDDDIFGLPDSPRVIGTPSGLAVRIRGVIDEPALRARMIPRLREAGDPGVRWAAALALADSAGLEDVRRAFLIALPGESDPPAQGELCKALADWAAGEPAGSPDRAQVFSAILEGALRTDAGALRLRSEDGLKRMTWTDAEVRAVMPLIDSGPFDQRRWAMAVLAGAASRPETPARGAVFESLERVASSEPEAKVRELAVTALSSFPDVSRAPAILMGALQDAAWHVRAAAARGLGRLGRSEEVLNALRRAEETDADERVRRAAGETRRLLSSK